MKKMMFSLAVACVSAATAFAESWFDNVVTNGTITSGSWSTTISTLMGDTNYITYKDMDHDLIFTANTAQTLPGDEATVNTTVKFTAMAMEDFIDLTNANESAWADAKGGLTIIEEPENTYKFYGLVNGTWQELADDTTVTAASIISGDTAVSVEVKIWENNGRKISYKVSDAFIGNSALGLTASGTGATISQIAYRGNCEISSLTGDRADEMWNLTFTTIAELASAVLTLNDNTTAELNFNAQTHQATYECKAKNLPKAITVAPPTGYYFFTSDASVKGSTGSVTAEATLSSIDGTTTEPISVSLPSGTTCEEPVAKVGSDAYKTLAAAVTAAGNPGTVTLWKSANETFEISCKRVIFEEGTDRNAIIGGAITIANGAYLQINSGKYVGTITVNGGLTLVGGYYSDEFDKGDLQKACADSYFAEDITGTYAFIVKEGQVVTPTGKDADKVPAGLTVADEVFPSTGMSDAEKTTYLATQADNGLLNWQNYVLGIDESTKLPEVAQASATATALTLDVANVDVRTQTGYDVVLKEGTSELDGGALTLEVGNHVIKICLVNTKANGGEEIVVGTKTIGVQEPTVSAAEAADAKLITVPYFDINGGTVTIDTVINKANLTEGATLTTVRNNAYISWVLNQDKEWVYQQKGEEAAVSASEFPVQPGQGLWLQNVANAVAFFQYGEVKTGSFEQIEPEKDAYNLLADPKGRTQVPLSIIVNPSVGDTIRIDKLSGTPDQYVCDSVVTDDKGQVTSSSWKLTHKVGKRTKVETVTDESNIPLGDTVWFIPTKDSLATIQW